MQQVLLGDRGDSLGLFRGVGNALAHDEDLARQRIRRGCPRKHGVDAVDAPEDLVRLVRARRRELAHDFFNACRHRLDIGNDARIGRAAQEDCALADAHGAFDLDGELRRRLPARARHARAMLVDDRVTRLIRMQRAFGFAYRIRVSLLVEAVRRHRHGRRMADRVHAVDREAVALERADDRIAPARRAAQRAALDDLGHMQGRPERIAERRGNRRKHGRITRAPGNDDISAAFERALECFYAHLADQVRRLVDIGFSQLADFTERYYSLRAYRLLHRIARDVRANRGEAKMQVLLARNVAHHGERLLEVRCCARTARGAYHERDAEAARAANALRKIDAHHGLRLRHLARAEIVRARIDRTHIGADQVGLAGETGVERLIRNAITQLARGRHHAQRFQSAAGGYFFAQALNRALHCSRFPLLTFMVRFVRFAVQSSSESSGPCCCAP